MIRNYLIVLWRGIRRRRFLTAINVLSLSAGIAFALLIGLFIRGEMKVNQSLKNVDELFLVENSVAGQQSSIEFFSPGALVPAASESYPDLFQGYYRFWDRGVTVSKDDKHFRLQSMIGDPSLIQVFQFKVLHGDATAPLRQPDCMVVTEEIARKFFNRPDVVNETLEVSTERNGVRTYRITAVIADQDKKNTVSDLMNMNAQIFLSFLNVRDFLGDADPDSWLDLTITYVRLRNEDDLATAEASLNSLLKERGPQAISEGRTVRLSALSDYYLITNHGAVLKLVISLTVVVAFILLLSITNFVNISIAGSFDRLKEVGVRKVIGGSRSHLVLQFLLESLSLSFLSGVIALGLYELLRPYFSDLLAAPLPGVMTFGTTVWLFLTLGVAGIGLLAGCYPALFQSGSKPMESLKGKARSVQGAMSFSKVLVTLQFAITLFIFCAAIVLSRQTNFFISHDLGYDGSQVLAVTSVPRQWDNDGFARMESARDAFMQSGKVEAVSLSWGVPSWGMGGLENIMFREDAPENTISANLTSTDEGFHDVYDLKLVEGTFFGNASQPLKSGQVVLNESAASALRVSAGDRVRIVGSDTTTFTVSGIVRDFHFESVHFSVKPVAIIHSREAALFRIFSFRLPPGSGSASVATVEALWKQVFPDEPFAYFFSDAQAQASYATEIQMKKASTVASLLMMVIVLAGILGLVSMNVSRRVKEVGVRKALGATVVGILLMFSKEYTRLLIAAAVIALPPAYYFSLTWLDNFAYHIDLAWWMFLVPAISLTALTWLLVCLQSFGTASLNPVDSLRYE